MRSYLVIPAMLSGLLLSFAQLHAADEPIKNKPVFVLSGRDSGVTVPMTELCRSEKELEAVWKEHEGHDSKRVCPKVDFGSFMVLALFNGTNQRDTSLSSYEVMEDAKSIRLRIHLMTTYRMINISMPRAVANDPEQYHERIAQINRCQCYSFIVLPASEKPIVIEDDNHPNHDDPHKWQESKRYPPIEKK